MRIKIDLEKKQIELLEFTPFTEVKKIVETLCKAYEWKEDEISVISHVEKHTSAPFVDQRPFWDRPMLPYVGPVTTGAGIQATFTCTTF